MSISPESQGQSRHKNDNKTYVYVLRIDFNDGTSRFPVKVERSGAGWEKDLDEAVEYFSTLHRGKGIVTVEYAKNLYLAGVSNPEEVIEWKSYREKNLSS